MCQLFNKFYRVLSLVYIWINLFAREINGEDIFCTKYDFACISDGSCIDLALLCDGLKDCSDGSDETVQECAERSCKEDDFRCTYGGCIRSSAKCDGRTDCVDNSDETNADCPPIVNDVNSTAYCNTSQFQCSSSRNCIDKGLLCDGKSDCDDNSDETVEQCENKICSTSEFRCDYGACINASVTCDGKNDCFDRSDEFEKTCSRTAIFFDELFDGPNTFDIRYSPPRACLLPTAADTSNLKMKINCPKEQPSCKNDPGASMASNTVVEYSCKHGYALPSGGNASVAVCWQKKWVPDFDTCKKICTELKPENVDLTCSYRGNIVKCGKIMMAGISVRPRCKAHYHATHPIHYRQIHCESSGRWTDELFKCVPDCGKPIKNAKLLIANANPEKFGEAPWHVAIYNVKSSKNRQLICGGTLISPYLVVSAAHCFFRSNIQKLSNASDYEIVVSKYTRPYSKQDNRFTKKYKIREIILPNDTYTGYSTRYVSDIVILWIKEKISLNSAVMPACVPWTEDIQLKFNPGEGSLGLASGFGKTENGTESISRRIAQLPFIGRNKCIESLPEDFKDIVTLDKFCAGSEKGAGVLEGDSGGGLLFRDSNLGVYYLKGIVSVKDDSSSSVAVFTSINSYLDWMEEVRIRVQRSTDYRSAHR